MSVSYVMPARRKVVVYHPDADAILSAIPHAKAFEHKGRTLVAVDHAEDEVRVLKNIGVENVPSPIQHYYNWPARFAAMEHQKETASFMVTHRKALCLNAPGTGKTLSVLWAADYLRSIGEVVRIAVIAPLSTIKTVWGSEIMHHLPHLRFVLVRGAKKRRLALVADPDIDVAIINHDGFTTMADAFAGYDLIIYDEATALKTPGTTRFKKFALFMRAHNPRLWMLTGTPIAQQPTDAWSLSRLVGSKEAPRSFNAFKELVMRRVTQFKWVPKDDALAECKRIMQPSIRYSLSECKDLPDTVHIDRRCELSEEQELAFQELRATAVLKGADVSAPNAAVLVGKLLQVCCGVAYDSEGKGVLFDDTGRAEALTSIIEEIGDKVIVFVPLRGVQDRLQRLLEDAGYSVASVHGGVVGKKRDDLFDAFQNTDTPRILLAHPRVAAHGLTLTRAKNIIWYAPIYSLEQYEQANARIRRLSTEGKTAVWHISGTAFERELYKRLQQRKRVLTEFLDLVQGTNE